MSCSIDNQSTRYFSKICSIITKIKNPISGEAHTTRSQNLVRKCLLESKSQETFQRKKRTMNQQSSNFKIIQIWIR